MEENEVGWTYLQSNGFTQSVVILLGILQIFLQESILWSFGTFVSMLSLRCTFLNLLRSRSYIPCLQKNYSSDLLNSVS